jgi:hypothetical protein
VKIVGGGARSRAHGTAHPHSLARIGEAGRERKKMGERGSD